MNPHIQRAQMLYNRSRFADAERELGMALTVDPEEPWAYALLGACRAAQDDFAKADELGRQALALAPNSSDIRHLVARIQLARNDLPASLDTIDQAIELAPHDADVYATRASVYARMKKWDKALADCEAALAIDPEHVEAVNVRSHARRATGDTQSAAEELRRVLAVDPDDAYSHSNLGWTHLQRSELADAERHFREAVRLDPELEVARIGVLETLKAKVPFYRWMLNYFIWMQTKAASAQWAIVIGLFIGYQVVRGIAANNPALAPFLLPVILLYVLFAVATWFAKPLGDAALLLHPFGRLALTAQEKREGAIVTALVAVVMALVIASMVASEDSYYSVYALLVGAPGLALAMSYKFEPRQPRRILQIAAGALAIGSVVVMLGLNTPILHLLMPNQSVVPVLVSIVRALRISVLGTLIGTNILASQQWKR